MSILNSDLSKQLAALALLICVVLACKSSRSLGSPHTLKSRDGKFELTVPAEMAESSTLSKDAEIAATNTPKDLYAFVITNRKTEYPADMKLEKLTGIVRRTILSEISATETPEPEPIVVNGNGAMRYRVVGSKAGVKVAYLITIVETSNHFHQIYTWTDPAKWQENESVLKQISDSFRANP